MKRVFKTRKNLTKTKEKKKKKNCWMLASTNGPHPFIEGGRWVSPLCPSMERHAGGGSLSTSIEGEAFNYGGWSSLLFLKKKKKVFHK
jgi:hypothetical protein